MSTIETTTTDDTATADAFAERIFGAALGAVETLAVYAGDRLGWYRGLAACGPATSEELAAATGTAERYVREWLELQAVNGIVTVDETGGTRRFTLPAAAAEVLTDEASLLYLAPLARMFAASAQQLPALLGAYRDGGGVSWEQLGDDARESQADMNRPWFERALPRPSPGCPRCTSGWPGQVPGSPTSGADSAGLPSRSRGPTPTRPSRGSTSTSRP